MKGERMFKTTAKLHEHSIIRLNRYLPDTPMVYFVATERPVTYRLKSSRIIYIGKSATKRPWNEVATQTIDKYVQLKEKKYKTWGNHVKAFILSKSGMDAKKVESACLGLFRNDHGGLPMFNTSEKWKRAEQFEDDLRSIPYNEDSLKKLIRSFEHMRKGSINVFNEPVKPPQGEWTRAELFDFLRASYPVQKLLFAALYQAQGKSISRESMLRLMNEISKQRQLRSDKEITGRDIAGALAGLTRRELRLGKEKNIVWDESASGYRIVSKYIDIIGEWIKNENQ